MDKKTLRERMSRLKGISNLIEKLSIRCPIGQWLAAACVLAVVLASCASPAARSQRDANAPVEPSAAARSRLTQGGPDAEDYGASRGYPIGDRATCLRGSVSLAFFVGCYSHFDQVYEGRVVRRATAPSPLARAASEPAVRYIGVTH